MKIRVAAALALPILGLLAACEKAEPRKLPDAPRIQLFKADASELQPGDSTRLSWTVIGASALQVLSPTGEELAVEGDVSAGEVTVSPDETAVYVLRAVGPGGRASAFVQVAVGEPLATVFLAAVPPEADPGEQVDLLWSAQGAASVTLADDRGETTTLQGTLGVFSFTAEQTRTFTLSAAGPDQTVKVVSTQVRVRPRIDLLTLVPGVARAGEPVRFDWQTQGADRLEIEEKTFGALHAAQLSGTSGEGQFEWTVPTVLPGTATELLDGHRLEFTVKVAGESTNTTLTRTFIRHLGEGPQILAFEAPEFATPGKPVAFQWKLSGAYRVQLFAGGLLVHEPRGHDPEVLNLGSAQVAGPQMNTRYELVVEGFGGARTSASKVVEAVALPVISGFNVSPQVNEAGDGAATTWTTQSASEVQIRIKNGPVVYSSRDKSRVQNGSTTLRPGSSLTYVLDAINQAGDLVSREATVVVANPAVVTVSPSHPTPGEQVTLAWNLPQADLDEVLGVLHPQPQQLPMSGQFVDLFFVPAARELEFVNRDDDVAALPTALAFRFPYAGSLRSAFHVSINGFLALEPTEAMPDNSTIPLVPGGLGTRQWLPTMVAPLWDDLVLGANGRVLYHVEGDTFPRRLIVQWDRLGLKDHDGSEVTFQVQLHETGEVSFVYKTLQPGTAASVDAGATIGIHGQGFSAAFGNNQGGLLAQDLELKWFNRPFGQESFTLPLFNTTRFSFFYRRKSDGHLVTVSVPVTLWGRDALSIREAMPQPLFPQGRWVELVNTTHEVMSLDGVEVEAESSGERYAFPPGNLILPGQIIVAAASADPMENGGVKVDFELPGLTFASQDAVIVRVNDMETSRLSWSASVAGQSVERGQWVLDSNKASKVCPREATFGGNGEKGTPGAPREPCWDYVVEPIAYDEVNILGSGKVEFTTPVSGRRWRAIQLDPPMTLFGIPYEELQFATHGYIAFEGITTDSYAYSSNREPRITPPNASVVPYGTSFWFNTTGANIRPAMANLWRRFLPGERAPGAPGEWVFVWNRMSHLSDGAADVTFQVRLFDDGVVEMHYGQMLNGSTTASSTKYGEGEGGPTWLENPTGTEALVVNLASREPGLRPYTGYRFTPVR
jgi:hypothetical protein